jgi:hypothetical protein
MAAKSGAGASVSSGASFQARVGAYLMVCGICRLEIDFAEGHALQAISFETTEAIDDINVEMANGNRLFVQAKAKIDYSIARDSELRAVFEQFERQYRANPIAIGQFILATTGRSSRKVIYDLRAALDAFRGGDEVRFRKDQPKALVEIIDELLRMVAELRATAGQGIDPDIERAILRRAFILVWDLEKADPLGQSVLLVLQSQHFTAPAAVWGKIVSDCISHSKARITVSIDQARADYERFRVVKGELPDQSADDLIRVEFGDMKFAVGREVVLGRLSSDELGIPAGLVIFEFYRFDDNCAERIRFSDGKCILQNGLEIELIRRTATHVGMTRLIDADPSLIGGQEVVFIPINSDDDFEVGLCAETHRARLRNVALENQNPLHCIHCGSPVSSASALLIEVTQEADLTVGLSHAPCLQPQDRVIGTIQSKFFEAHSALINFDVNGWFRAAHGGQIAFANAKYLGDNQVAMAWGGRRSQVNPGQFVVEMQLQGGGSEFVTVRNGVHRFQRAEADEFAERLRDWIGSQGAADPLCYSDQTKTFGVKSVVLKQIGGRERLTPVESARVRQYDQRLAARYSRPGSWYAPLLFVRCSKTGTPLRILGTVVLLTDPFVFANHLSNWKEAGIPVEFYETVSLLTDAQVDNFMAEMEESGSPVIIDPLLVTDTSTRFVAGTPFQSIAALAVS